MRQFVYVVEGTRTGYFKIGTTKDPTKRFRILSTQGGQPLRVLLVLEEGRAYEKELHQRFAKSRTVGEWFIGTPDLLEFIREALSDLAFLEKHLVGDDAYAPPIEDEIGFFQGEVYQ